MATATATAAAGALSLCCSSLTPKLSKLQITTTMTTPLRTNVSFLSNSLSSLTLLNSRRRQLTFSLTPKSTDTDTDTDTEAVAATVVEPETVEEEQPGSVEEGQEPETVEESEVVVEAEEKPKREEVFAVVMVGSRQYIVFPGRYIYTQRLKGASVNDKITLNKVLLVGTKTSTYIGKPIVPNATVEAVVEEQTLDKKVIVFKYKKKKNYRRNIGHRQPITRIRVTSITGYQDSPAVSLP